MNASTNGAHDEARLARLSSAFQNGVVLVDSSGAIVWMDRTARRRVDGELRNLALPLDRSESNSVDCFMSPVDLTIDGECVTLGVIQEADEKKRTPDLMAAIEAVLADSTSWFTRTVMDRLRSVSQANGEEPSSGPKGNGACQLDTLSAREREVLELICEGKGNAQMAGMLGLSENTVRNHIAALYRKIGVNRRTAAVIWARERGIIGRERPDPVRSPRRAGNGRTGTLPY